MPAPGNARPPADRYLDVTGTGSLPAAGAILVSLEQWRGQLDRLIARSDPLGIRLRGDEHPEAVADDLDHFALIAIELRDCAHDRACGYARLLRECWGFRGELRAVGEVKPEQWPFLKRAGFDAFESSRPDLLRDRQPAPDAPSPRHPASTDRFRPVA